MTKERFVEIIELHQKQNELVNKYSDLISYDSPIIEFGWKMFDAVLQEAFSDENQLDWIRWWLYDRISFITGEELPYYDGDKECYMHTIDDLWEYISKLK